MANRTKLTERARQKFLQVLGERAVVAEAARAINVTRSYMHQYKNKIIERNADLPEDERDTFPEDWDNAVEEAIDRLEAEAWRRAVDGVEEPITFRGMITDYQTRYSDRLLEFLLAGRRKDVFAKRQELTGADGGALDNVIVVLPSKDSEADGGES